MFPNKLFRLLCKILLVTDQTSFEMVVKCVDRVIQQLRCVPIVSDDTHLLYRTKENTLETDMISYRRWWWCARLERHHVTIDTQS